MAKNKISRKELLKKEDEFISLSSKVSQYITAHAKQFKYGFISIVAVVVIVIIASLYIRYVNKKALVAHNLAYKNLVTDVSTNNTEDTVKKLSSVKYSSNLSIKYSLLSKYLFAIS